MKIRRNILSKISVINGIVLGLFNPFMIKITYFIIIWIIVYEFVGDKIKVTSKYGYIATVCYFCLALFEIIREHCFGIKWYARKYPKSVECPQCHTKVRLENPEYGRGVLTFPTIYGYGWYHLKAFYFRPRLHLHCPNCGLDEMVCPHCDNPISDEEKKCPHCGKRVLGWNYEKWI